MNLKLKEIRMQKGITQEKLAKKIGNTQRNVSNWENGICEPDLKTLYLLGRVLEVRLEELLVLEQREEEGIK